MGGSADADAGADASDPDDGRESVDWLQDVRFVEPTLVGLDSARTDALVVLLSEDERPPRGVAGLIDWRGGGRISDLLASGFLTGAAGEKVLVPGSGIFPSHKFVLCGIGSIEAFDAPALDAFVATALTALSQLLVSRVAVEFPRPAAGGSAQSAGVSPLEERMLSQVLDGARSRRLSCEWSLVVRPAVHRALREQLRSEAWRVEDPSSG